MVGSPLNNPINTTPPTKYLSQVANPFMQPWQLYMLPAPNSTAQPTTPASPTNTWWMMFALPGGQGYYHVQVVPDGSVTDASQQISISEAQSLGYNVQINDTFNLARDVFDPNTNLGNYYTLNSPVGMRFTNQEQFINNANEYRATRNWAWTGGAVEGMLPNMANGPPRNYSGTQQPDPSSWPNKVTDWSDLSVTVSYTIIPQTGTLDAILVKDSPYITLRYTGTITPLLYTVGQSYVAQVQVLATNGKVLFEWSLERSNLRPAAAFTGTIFRITMTDNSVWKVYTSSPITWTQQTYWNYVIIPDNEVTPPNPTSFQYLRMSDALGFNPPINPPTGPQLGFEYQYRLGGPDAQQLNALEASAPFQGYIRIAKVPMNNPSAEPLLDSYSRSIPIRGAASIVSLTSSKSTISSSKSTTSSSKSTTSSSKSTTSSSKSTTSSPSPPASLDQNTSLGYSFSYTCIDLGSGQPTGSPALFAYAPITIADLMPGVTPQGNGYLTMRGQTTFVSGTSLTFQPATLSVPSTPDYFEPNVKLVAGVNQLTSDDINTLIAQLEWDAQWYNVTNYISSYTGGKQLQALAEVCLFLSKVLADQGQTPSAIYSSISLGLGRIKAALTRWLGGMHYVYDHSWGGTLCTSGLVSSTADYSNALYQDHHFHYGYFIQSAAMVAYLDNLYLPSGQPKWISQPNHNNTGTMADSVELLIRDVTNPSSADAFYTTWRMYDWAEGHQRAAGLFPTGDGGNEESTAEDANYFFGLMMWGAVTGNAQVQQLGQLLSTRLRASAAAYWQVGSSTTIYAGSQSTPPSTAPMAVAEYPSVGVLWDGKADPSTWFFATDYCEVGIQAIMRVPTLLLSLHDAQWATRMTQYFINPSVPSAQWHIWTIPPSNANWYSILLPLLARFFPSGARTVWNDPRCLTDPGNTRGTVLFTVLYAQAANYAGQFQAPYAPLKPASSGYPPPSGFPLYAQKEYTQLTGPMGPIAAYTSDFNSLPSIDALKQQINNNSIAMGLNPYDFPNPQAWATQAASYQSQYNTFNAAYNNQVNITAGLPPQQQLQMWQSFAVTWGLPPADSVAAIQTECTQRLAQLNTYYGLCVQNEAAMNSMLEKGALNSCLNLLGQLSNELLYLSKQTNSTLFELQAWASGLITNPNFATNYPYLASNNAGKSCVTDFCSYSKIPVPSKYRLPSNLDQASSFRPPTTPYHQLERSQSRLPKAATEPTMLEIYLTLAKLLDWNDD